MELVSIREIFKNNKDYIGKEVNIGGWLRSKRDSKSFGFLVVNDGTFFEPIQVVYSDELDNGITRYTGAINVDDSSEIDFDITIYLQNNNTYINQS